MTVAQLRLMPRNVHYAWIIVALTFVVVVVTAGGEAPDRVSTAKLDDRIVATPAVVGNVLYVRTGKTLYAFAGK